MWEFDLGFFFSSGPGCRCRSWDSSDYFGREVLEWHLNEKSFLKLKIDVNARNTRAPHFYVLCAHITDVRM